MLRRWVFGALVGAISTTGMLSQASGASDPQSETVTADAAAKLPAWDVVSVHAADPQHCTSVRTMRYSPNGMDAVCVPLLFVIQQAYALLQPTLILGAPDWVKSDRLWNIDAKVAPEDAATYAALKPSDKYRMMRSALADRFHMKAHMERREIPVYDLVIVKGGPKLKEAAPDDAAKGHLWMRTPGDLEDVDTVVASLPIMLNTEVGRATVDRTGLTGRYDFTLKYVPASKTVTDETGGASIFTAIQEQLGLKLQPAKARMDVLVIDSIERPAEN
jgi:uncharacterized protein (TIGR03435 family)